jgi:lysophospholipase L1-like esterase
VGIGANPITNGFAYLTGKQLAIWFPGTKFINLGYSGYSSEGFVNGNPKLIKTILSSIAGYDCGQMTRAAIYLGGLNIAHSGCTACAYGLTYAQGVSVSYLYKTQMQTILTDMLSLNPNCKVVVCSLVDPSNNGLGPKFDFIPSNPNLVPVFNQRLQEIVAANAVTANVAYCDFYNSMMGHDSWYTPKSFGDDAYHPTNEGHDLLAIVLEAVFADMDKNSVKKLK